MGDGQVLHGIEGWQWFNVGVVGMLASSNKALWDKDTGGRWAVEIVDCFSGGEDEHLKLGGLSSVSKKYRDIMGKLRPFNTLFK